MKMEEAFQILGIAPTADENLIKDAYRKKLVSVNPEDDQEGFKRLRKAYEKACAYAENEEKEEEEDGTPSGIWILQAYSIYGRLSTRCDEKTWEKMFREEIFLSLEENEACRRKFLVFLMQHYYFPYEIWQLFDRYLDIREERSRLKEEFQAEFIQFLIQRCTEKESMDYTLFRGADNGNYDLFLDCYWECVVRFRKKEYGGIGQFLEKADATGIFHPYMEAMRAFFWRNRGRKEEAGRLFVQLKKDYPNDSVVLLYMLCYFWEEGRKEEAWACCRELKELEPENDMANRRLAYYYYEKQDYQSAKDCIQSVSDISYDEELLDLLKKIHGYLLPELRRKWEDTKDTAIAMKLAEGYLQEERYYAAFRILNDIRDKIPKEQKSAYLLLLARVYLERAENERVLETLQAWQDMEGEKRQEDRNTAVKLKISAYHMKGRGAAEYFDKAAGEYEKVKDRLRTDPELLLEMAQIFLEKRDYIQCLELSEILLDEFRIYFAYVLMLKAYWGLGDGAGVIRCGKKCVEFFPGYAYPYEEMANVYYSMGRKNELEEIWKLAEENGIESCYLDYRAFHGENVKEDFPIDEQLWKFDAFYEAKLLMTGNLEFYKRGYPLLTEYLRMYPCNWLLGKRGFFSMEAKDVRAAMKDFQKVLERDLADAYAYYNIGCLYQYSGNYESALVYFQKAMNYMHCEGNGRQASDACYMGQARTYELMGEYGQAAEVYRCLHEIYKTDEKIIRGLTVNYARTGQIKKAKKILESFYSPQNVLYYTPAETYAKVLAFCRTFLYAAKFRRAFHYIHGLSSFGLSSDTPIKYRFKYYIMQAWEQILKGHYEKSLKALKLAAVNLGAPFDRKKEQIDFVMNRLFILTIYGETIVGGQVDAERKMEPEGSRPCSENRKLSGNREAQKRRCGSDGNIRRDVSACLEDLEEVLDWACKLRQVSLQTDPQAFLQTNPETEPTGRNLIESKEFFYKERYVRYVEFVLALYGQGISAGVQAWEAMAKSLRCRDCSHASCMRLKIAKALLLEQQGQKQQAMNLYSQLAEEQPYNLYAQAKLKCCGEEGRKR